MTLRLPFSRIVPSLELQLIPNILEAKLFAHRSDYDRRRTKYKPLDPDNPIPLYKQSELNHPVNKIASRRLKTISQRLQEAKLTDSWRPGFTYRGALRNYKRAKAREARNGIG